MDLNIRNAPEALIKLLKQEALDRGITLREWVLQRLGVPPEAIPQQGEPADVAEALRDFKPATSCKGCGALNGMHFRGCKA